MITENGNVFHIISGESSYLFRVMNTGHLEHLYYGRKINAASGASALYEKQVFAPGNTMSYNDDNVNFTLEDICLEMSSYGKGDYREPFVEVVNSDGSSTSDFLFKSYEISRNAPDLATLPCSYDDSEKVERLRITLEDSENKLLLTLDYYVYDDCGVITRTARLQNLGSETVKVKRLMSTQVDFHDSDYVFTSFGGEWASEMRKNVSPVRMGKLSISSVTGTSSSRANPFVMLSRPNTDEDMGEVYGFNLVYSSNHLECADSTGFGKLRFVSGINPSGFSYLLESGGIFEAPEAVMAYSRKGFNGMSGHMHAFVREHIVRGKWKNKPRPVLLNSWESAYFDINEKKLLSLAKAGKKAGMELLVMDDGWFGERSDDTTSLGDWTPNPKKLPDGLKGLGDKLAAIGMGFGIWVEPEMVSVKSRLYEAHPEWAVDIPDKQHSEGRHQRILDLCNPEVQDFIIEEMSRVFSNADISYVKWDMNRTVTDAYSKYLPKERQGEFCYRYEQGLFRCMRELSQRFPDILFEGCSAGGNRFDLGILCTFPQIWASDNTDAVVRAEMQTNYSYGYPMSVVTAHVSACPNHQTLRNTPLETRFNTAAFAVLGYECNLCDLGKEELDSIAAQVKIYKKWRKILQFGTFYRGRNGGNVIEWTTVSRNKKYAVGYLMQKMAQPNSRFEYYKAKGLAPQKKYRFKNRFLKHSILDFGDLVNTVSPIHIAQGSLLQSAVSHIIKMDGETEDVAAYGDLLMYAGVKLKQGFAGTGYSEEVRLWQDFASRIYFMTEEE